MRNSRHRSLLRRPSEPPRQIRELNSLGSQLSNAPLLGVRGASWPELRPLANSTNTFRKLLIGDFARAGGPPPLILNRFAPLSVRSNPRSLLVGRRVGRFVASLEKCSATKFRCWAVPRPLPGPPGGQAPARAPGGAGFKGQRPLRTVSPPFTISSLWSHFHPRHDFF